MSVERLSHLTEEERTLCLEAPALVALLIGKADGNFNNSERERARNAMKFRQTNGDALLFDYFKEVYKTFDNVLQSVEERYAGDTNEVIMKVSAELSKLNDILPKLDKRFASMLIKNLKSLAVGVANSSGGILGIFDESEEEANLVDLPMIVFED
ncbi:MAG: hypothetical protein K1X55_09895 [Chitinophagales bacterium]|nr:hypothetical protein [Chitinophagales bacterium]